MATLPQQAAWPMHALAADPAQAVRMRQLGDDNSALPIRGAYARDRDRILYCKSFRRLAHKTQVYFTESGNEHLHTRLSHTLEVSHIAKTIARGVGANMELVEAISLGHDVGHAPFGHAGERELDSFLAGRIRLPSAMRRYYRDELENVLQKAHNGENPILPRAGFKHNLQSVRLFTFLENYDPTPGSDKDGIYEDGLNLTLQTLDGILNHTSLPKTSESKICSACYPDTAYRLFDALMQGDGCAITIEGQIVSVADEIAQVVHDLSDAVDKEAYDLAKFLKLPPVRTVLEKYKSRQLVKVSHDFVGSLVERAENTTVDYGSGRRRAKTQTAHVLNYQLCSILMSYFIRSTIDALRTRLASVRAPEQLRKPLLAGSIPPDAAFEQLRKYKDDIVLNCYQVNRMDNKGKFVIRNLISAYITDPRQMSDACLCRYMLMQSRSLTANARYLEEWINRVNPLIKDKCQLSPQDVETVAAIIKRSSEASDFRGASTELLDRLIPYLALDSVFRRTIADYIGTMTDGFALREMAQLYA